MNELSVALKDLLVRAYSTLADVPDVTLGNTLEMSFHSKEATFHFRIEKLSFQKDFVVEFHVYWWNPDLQNEWEERFPADYADAVRALAGIADRAVEKVMNPDGDFQTREIRHSNYRMLIHNLLKEGGEDK